MGMVVLFKRLLLCLVVLACLTAAASATLPAHVAQRIAANSRDNRELAREDAAIARPLNQRSFTETIARARHLRVEAEMSSVVIGAIADSHRIDEGNSFFFTDSLKTF